MTPAPTTYLPIDGDRPLKHAMHAEDGRLRWVDDGCAHEGAEHAAITDGERTPIHILYCQGAGTSLDTETEINCCINMEAAGLSHWFLFFFQTLIPNWGFFSI